MLFKFAGHVSFYIEKINKMKKTRLNIELSPMSFILWLAQTGATGAIKKNKLMKAKLSKDGLKMKKINFFMNPEIVKLIIITSMYLEEVEQSA